MTDNTDRDSSKTKTIKLTEWNPNEFNLWQRMVSMTFQVYDVWTIVNGSVPKPTPPSSNENTNEPTTSNENDAGYIRSLADWRRRNILACEALINCVKGHELCRISLLDNAHEIWNTLELVYGRKSSMHLTTAQRQIRLLARQSGASMQSHIDAFELLQSTIDNNSITPMSNPDVNQTFITSLGDSWNQFHQANQHNLSIWTLEEVYDEVKAFEEVAKTRVTLGSTTSSFSSNSSIPLTSGQANVAFSKKGKRKNYGPYNNGLKKKVARTIRGNIVIYTNLTNMTSRSVRNS